MNDPIAETPITETPITEITATEHSLDAFVERYRATSPTVLAYLARATGSDKALAEDLTADVYLQAMAAWRSGNVNAGNEAWLLTTARNRLIDYLRRADVEQRKLALIHNSEREDSTDDFSGIEAASILRCAQQLPPMQRAVLALRYANDLSISEIAFELDRSVDAVDSLRRARTGLRALIDAHNEDTP